MAGFLTPEQLEVLEMGGLHSREAELEAQLQALRARREGPKQQFHGALGNLFGGIGNVVGDYQDAEQMKKLEAERAAGRGQTVQAREKFLEQYGGDVQTPALDPRTPPLLRKPELMDEAEAAADALHRKDQLLDAALLSGDPVLTAFAKGEQDRGLKLTLAKAKQGLGSKKDMLQVAEGMRKEFLGHPVAKAMDTIASAYGNIQEMASGGTPASDMGLIFSFMKLLDPGSTVREGEYANAQNAGGVPERVVAMYNKAIKGDFLTPDMRKDFLGRAGKLYGTALKRYQPLAEQYRGLATRAGIAPEDVVLDFGFQKAKAEPTRKTVNGVTLIEDPSSPTGYSVEE